MREERGVVCVVNWCCRAAVSIKGLQLINELYLSPVSLQMVVVYWKFIVFRFHICSFVVFVQFVSSFATATYLLLFVRCKNTALRKLYKKIQPFFIQWNIDCGMNISDICRYYFFVEFCHPEWMSTSVMACKGVTALAYYSPFLYSYCSDLMVKWLSCNSCGIGWSVVTENAVWFSFRPSTAVVCWGPALSCCVLSQVKSSLF